MEGEEETPVHTSTVLNASGYLHQRRLGNDESTTNIIIHNRLAFDPAEISNVFRSRLNNEETTQNKLEIQEEISKNQPKQRNTNKDYGNESNNNFQHRSQYASSQGESMTSDEEGDRDGLTLAKIIGGVKIKRKPWCQYIIYMISYVIFQFFSPFIILAMYFRIRRKIRKHRSRSRGNLALKSKILTIFEIYFLYSSAVLWIACGNYAYIRLTDRLQGEEFDFLMSEYHKCFMYYLVIGFAFSILGYSAFANNSMMLFLFKSMRKPSFDLCHKIVEYSNHKGIGTIWARLIIVGCTSLIYFKGCSAFLYRWYFVGKPFFIGNILLTIIPILCTGNILGFFVRTLSATQDLEFILFYNKAASALICYDSYLNLKPRHQINLPSLNLINFKSLKTWAQIRKLLNEIKRPDTIPVDRCTLFMFIYLILIFIGVFLDQIYGTSLFAAFNISRYIVPYYFVDIILITLQFCYRVFMQARINQEVRVQHKLLQLLKNIINKFLLFRKQFKDPNLVIERDAQWNFFQELNVNYEKMLPYFQLLRLNHGGQSNFQLEGMKINTKGNQNKRVSEIQISQSIKNIIYAQEKEQGEEQITKVNQKNIQICEKSNEDSILEEDNTNLQSEFNRKEEINKVQQITEFHEMETLKQRDKQKPSRKHSQTERGTDTSDQQNQILEDKIKLPNANNDCINANSNNMCLSSRQKRTKSNNSRHSDEKDPNGSQWTREHEGTEIEMLNEQIIKDNARDFEGTNIPNKDKDNNTIYLKTTQLRECSSPKQKDNNNCTCNHMKRSLKTNISSENNHILSDPPSDPMEMNIHPQEKLQEIPNEHIQEINRQDQVYENDFQYQLQLTNLLDTLQEDIKMEMLQSPMKFLGLITSSYGLLLTFLQMVVLFTYFAIYIFFLKEQEKKDNLGNSL